MFHYIYVLRSKKDKSLYVGYTRNVFKRLRYHNLGLNFSTRTKKPWVLIYFEAFLDKEDALRREKYFKKTQGKRALKLMLRKYFKNNG